MGSDFSGRFSNSGQTNTSLNFGVNPIQAAYGLPGGSDGLSQATTSGNARSLDTVGSPQDDPPRSSSDQGNPAYAFRNCKPRAVHQSSPTLTPVASAQPDNSNWSGFSTNSAPAPN